MSAEPCLRIRDLRKRFGGLTALAGVSLDVPAGLVYGLIGPNGSGKTTLFDIVSGFSRADGGHVTFGGTRLDGLPPYAVARLGLCRTFQATACPRHMTVMENMLLAPQAQRGERLVDLVFHAGAVARQERMFRERAREFLSVVDLAGKADEYAGTLSGGQRKLLALAQALMADPKLILLDEPVSGVNPVLAGKIAALVRKLRDGGRNFLVVEHNMPFVRATCDRVAVLDAGRIIADGEPGEVLAREDVLGAYLARPRAERDPPGTAPTR